MQTKTFRAASIQEALQLVRQELGPDAIVLRTREVRPGGLLRLLHSKRSMEVVASIEPPTLRRSLLPSGRIDQGIDLAGPEASRISLAGRKAT
jgi:flagellar biosynthesis protein FlhF